MGPAPARGKIEKMRRGNGRGGGQGYGMGPGADMAHLNAQRDPKMDPTSERRFALRKRIVEAGDERPSMLEDGILALADDLVHSVWPVL